ncbi:MAG: FprA family A-type flavoprotein [Bacteroidota bacterium]
MKTDEKILNITNDVTWIGVLDPGLRHFDVVMETEFGTTYNSYFIAAQKKAIVETAKEKFFDIWMSKLTRLCNLKELEYVFVNHTEPDHSGSLKKLIELAPQVKVVGSGNAIRYLSEIMNCEFQHIVVKESDVIDLGNKKMKVIGAPNLHWPDSIYTYLEEDKVLFTCDSFGAHYCDAEMFDDKVGDFDKAFRYYFHMILRPFSKFMLKAIEKIRPLDIKAICTGHGPLLTSDWKRYVDLTEELATRYLEMPAKERVFIPFVAAYNKTGVLAEAIAKGVRAAGNIEVEVCDIEHVSPMVLDDKITRCTGIIVGCPTINQNILLPVYTLFAVINPLRDRGKLAGCFGSYGWSGEASKILETNLQNLKLNYFPGGLFVKFTPSEADLLQAEEYGLAFGKKILELNRVTCNG